MPFNASQLAGNPPGSTAPGMKLAVTPQRAQVHPDPVTRSPHFRPSSMGSHEGEGFRPPSDDARSPLPGSGLDTESSTSTRVRASANRELRGAAMHARVTRYEGGSPEDLEENLQQKKHVLPTEPGQTEGMKGVIFLTDRASGTITVISLWEDEKALRESEDEAIRVREEVMAPGESATVQHCEVALLEVEQAGPGI